MKKNGHPLGTKTSQAYEYVKRRILDGTYSPGHRLVLENVSRRSRYEPAPGEGGFLGRLEAEGYVAYKHNAGARVAALDPAAYESTQAVIAVLEGAATAGAAPYVTPDVIRKAKELNQEMRRRRDSLMPRALWTSTPNSMIPARSLPECTSDGVIGERTQPDGSHKEANPRHHHAACGRIRGGPRPTPGTAPNKSSLPRIHSWPKPTRGAFSRPFTRRPWPITFRGRKRRSCWKSRHALRNPLLRCAGTPEKKINLARLDPPLPLVLPRSQWRQVGARRLANEQVLSLRQSTRPPGLHLSSPKTVPSGPGIDAKEQRP